MVDTLVGQTITELPNAPLELPESLARHIFPSTVHIDEFLSNDGDLPWNPIWVMQQRLLVSPLSREWRDIMHPQGWRSAGYDKLSDTLTRLVKYHLELVFEAVESSRNGVLTLTSIPSLAAGVWLYGLPNSNGGGAGSGSNAGLVSTIFGPIQAGLTNLVQSFRVSANTVYTNGTSTEQPVCPFNITHAADLSPEGNMDELPRYPALKAVARLLVARHPELYMSICGDSYLITVMPICNYVLSVNPITNVVHAKALPPTFLVIPNPYRET